jgi:fructoselysine-6-P-deglycase FrlB-like protein
MLVSKSGVTYSEILEQPDIWQQAIKIYNKERETLIWIKKMKFNQVVFVGGGISYYASLYACDLFKSVGRIHSYAFQASDIFSSDSLPFDSRLKTLVIAVSRSGNTDETVWAVEYIRKKMSDVQVLSFVCQVNSALEAVSDKTIIMEAAFDASPVPIRAFSSIIYLLELMAGALGSRSDFLGELSKIPKNIDIKSFHDEITRMRRLQDFKKIIFAGTGPNLALAAYGSTIMKSMSSTISFYLNSFELRQNHFIGIGPDTLVAFILSDKLMEQEIEAVRDVSKLRAQVLLIHEDLDEKVEGKVEYAIKLKSGLSTYSRTMYIIPYLQMLAFQHALAIGKNPDKPLHVVESVSYKSKPWFQEESTTAETADDNTTTQSNAAADENSTAETDASEKTTASEG